MHRDFPDEIWKAFNALVEAHSSLTTGQAYGYLPGVAIHPDPAVMPSQALFALFADAEWEGEAELRSAFDVAGKVYNHVGDAVRARDFAMPPIDCGPELVEFCRGFLDGLDLSSLWRKHEFALELAGPFEFIASLGGEMALLPTRREQIDFVRGRCSDFDDDDLHACLFEMAEEFDDMRRDIVNLDPRFAAARPVRRSGPKVGRNDPCPCGSGRKFKHCCNN